MRRGTCEESGAEDCARGTGFSTWMAGRDAGGSGWVCLGGGGADGGE